MGDTRFGVVLVVASAALGCQPNACPLAEEAPERAVRSVIMAHSSAYAAGDAEAIGKLFATDAVQLPPQQGAIRGREAITARYRSVFARSSGELSATMDEVVLAGDRAFVRGSYVLKTTPHEGEVTTEQRGQYLTVLEQRPADGWAISWDIWNRTVPPRDEEQRRRRPQGAS